LPVKLKEEIMSQLLSKLSNNNILLLDGALGTVLHQRGLEPGACPESLNAQRPEMVQTVIAEYVAAGSDIVETNSFGGTRYQLGHYGLEDKVFEYNKLAAEISKKAAADHALVAGSIGPTGQFLKPLGNVSQTDMYQAFKEQIAGLIAGGVDMFFIETMMALDEAEVAFHAARENSQVPVIVSFTFEKNTKDLYRTMMGVSPEQVAQRFTKLGADAVGSNCGSGIEYMIEIAEIMAQHTDKYIFIKPNAGLPVIEDGQTVYKATPQEMGERVGELLDIGVRLFGGCCGTTVEHIKTFRAVIDKHLTR